MVLENYPWYMLVWGQDQDVCQAANFSQIVDFTCQTRGASLLEQGTLRGFCSGREPKIYQELSSLGALSNLI